MTGYRGTLTILALSMAGSILYMLYGIIRRSKEKVIKGAIMLFSPPAGSIYFIFQYILGKFLDKNEEVDLSEITFSDERRDRMLRPDVEAEMQAVPLEEIFLVSSDSDKRKRLLMELKKDYISNYGAIVKALGNNDAETSHYAATAISNAKTQFENGIRDLEQLYAKNNKDLVLIRNYSDYVLRYIESNVLDPIEIRKYRFLYIAILTTAEKPEEFLTETDYANIVEQSIKTGDLPVAEKWARLSQKHIPGESGYLNLLKVYFYTNDSQRFFEVFNEMRRSDIALSHNGLSLVRFFISKNTHRTRK